MNLKWLRLLTAVFLSAIMLMGCNNVEEDNDPPPPDTEEPFEITSVKYYCPFCKI